MTTMVYIDITGYKFLTQQSAVDAQQSLNTYYGLPQQPDDITRNWCSIFTADLDSPVFWYIVFDESMRQVLGNPEVFQVLSDDPYSGNQYVGS